MSNLVKINNEQLLDFIIGDEYQGTISFRAQDLGVSETLIDFIKDEHIRIESSFEANNQLYVIYSKIVTPSELALVKGEGIFKGLKLYGSSGQYKGIVDGKGKSILNNIYYSIEQFMNDIVKVEFKGKKYGLMRLSGETILEPIYERIDPLSELVFAVCKDGKLGFMNLKGEQEIPFIYEVSENEVFFSGGLACVLKQNEDGEVKYGYINHKNQEILPFKFVLDTPFKNSDIIENWQTYKCGYGNSFTREYYYLSLDGTIKHFQTEHIEDSRWSEEYEEHHTLDENNRDDDWLDAFEGDASNRWNIE